MAIAKKINDFMSRGSWIRKMFEEGAHLKAKYGAENVFDYTLGNPILPPPREILDELKRLATDEPEKGHGYMANAGYEDVRGNIAKYFNGLYNLGFEARHIVMTTGAGGGMNVLLKSLLDPDSEVIIIAPYFVEYLFYIDNHGGKPVTVNADKDFNLDVAAIEEKINEKTKAVIITSPNNPTGVVYPAETLERLGDMLEMKQKELGKEIYLINDEPYRKLLYDGIGFPSHLLCYRNSILATSHSKDFSIPGERIGYVAVNPAITGCRSLIDAMTFSNRVLGFVNAPAIWQKIAGACQHATVNIAWYQERRDAIYEGLKSIGYEVAKPQGAFYFFPRSPIPDDVEFTTRAAQLKLLLVPGKGFGTPGYFRIAYCTATMEMIERSMPLFKQLYEEFTQ
ncbi:MAG: pyridoxal phosphate-dependent aminotransferase [Pseudomonadota bacterium]